MQPDTVHEKPKVFLVGAGPGDPELLTMKAVKAIAQATVLLVDDLVGEGVLTYAQPGARQIYVGKRGGCASTPQRFIEQLMIREACRGERVVRLKGGDPFIFGRGGEEVERLRAAGLVVEVVSGITAGLAATTSLGVPWTHRAHAHGVVLVTGHAQPGSPGPDWRLLAKTSVSARLTLVIYMGVASARRLQEELLAGGLPADTPVGVIQHASLPQQRHVVTTLDALALAIERECLGSPAVIIVGDVLRGVQAAPSCLSEKSLARA
jgi:uroporphyrin-III C-methyltransferase